MKKLFVLAVIVLFAGVVGLHADNGSASITDIDGDVQVKKAGATEFIDAEVDMDLGIGDEIVTKDKAEAEIVFDDDNTLVKLEANTSIVLKKIEKTKNSRVSLIELTLGKIIAMMKKQDGVNKSLEVKTPSAIAAVKGTEFAMEVVSGGSYVGVFEGEVDVASFDLNGAKLHDVPVKKDKGMTVKYNSRNYVPNAMRYDWKKLEFIGKMNKVRNNLGLYKELKKNGMWGKITEARRAAKVRDLIEWMAKNPQMVEKMPPAKKEQILKFIEANKQFKDAKIDDLRKKYPLLIDKYREVQRQRMERIRKSGAGPDDKPQLRKPMPGRSAPGKAAPGKPVRR